MRRISLYGHVVELLGMLESVREPADQLAGRFLRERRYLGSKDRRFISDLYFDILRNRTLLEFHARHGISALPSVIPVTHVRHLGDARVEGGPAPSGAAPGPPQAPKSGQFPPARVERERHLGDAHVGAALPAIALVTAHQLHIAREDPATLLPDVSDLWRMVGATGNVSALVESIRASAVPHAILGDPVARMSLQHSIPPDIVREWIDRFGEDAAESLCKASNMPAPTTIRVNTLRCTREECRAALAREGVATTPTRYSPVGLILGKRVNTGALESYRSGMFEMQDEGSQLISMLVDPSPGSVVVDACAGAGGKSLHLSALMNGRGTIHAFDTDAVRLRSLRARVLRSGADIIRDTRVDADTPPDPGLGGIADALLIDAPCSGVGTYRRNPGAKSGFTAAYSASLSDLQSSLLERYHVVVRPGGRLVYATCTMLRRENESVVERFLAQHPEFHPLPVSNLIGSLGIPILSDPFLVLLPNETGTDGFFAAVLERARIDP